MSFENGEYVVKQGEKGDNFYIIVEFELRFPGTSVLNAKVEKYQS